MDKKDILCPDCRQTYISSSRYRDFGKCVSCQHRETMAINNNMEYIKYADLPEEEQIRITRQREIKRKSAKKSRDEKKGIIVEKVAVEPVVKVRSNQIYTPDIIENIKILANENITPAELLSMLQSIYPDKPFTAHNLNNIISRYGIPHSSRRGRKPIKTEILRSPEAELPLGANIDEEIIEDISSTDIELNDDVDNSNILDIDENIVDISVDNLDVIDVKEPIVDNQIIINSVNVVDDRFKPIKDEIDSIINLQFKQAQCSLNRDYTTADYVNMLEILLYVVENGSTIVDHRRKQQNIMNAYQSDMIHEMENTIAKPGDTYLSDKMYVIRKYRRHFEQDYRDIATLKKLRDSIDITMLKETLTNMKRNLNQVENPIFKPLIDTTLIDKYDWAQPLDPDSAKAKISVVKYNPNDFRKNVTVQGRPVTRIGMTEKTPPTSQLNARTRKSLKIYRVSCKVSGGGYGAFTNWYRDYECDSYKTALAYATNTLNQLSKNKKGMIYSDLDVVELNLKPNENVEQTEKSKPESVASKVPIEFTKEIELDDVSGLTKHKFKITCQISGCGYGAFKPWERVYTCVSEIQAKQAAGKELDEIKQDYSGILITQLQCKQIQ